jgi:hypothetical protein
MKKFNQILLQPHLRSSFVVLSILILSGCAVPEIHYWGGYESSLYDRYVDNKPQESEEDVRSTLLEAESQHKRIPPGVSADYGFMLYKRGDMAGAISYFEKEKKLYPESGALMAKLIERINKKSKAAVPVQTNTGGKL